MAIAFARAEYVSRSKGKNACCKGSYNANVPIRDNNTNIVYNFWNKKDNVYHEILLPTYVDPQYKNSSYLMNEVERVEKKSNSQLLKEYVLALPDDKNISLEIKKEMVHEFIKANKWIENGLGVQVDIHKPHDGEQNWHAHLLVTTRRFLDHGKSLGEKARDLEPQVRGGRSDTYVKSKEEINIGSLWKDIQNEVFKKHGLENKVDTIGLNAQEHIGPVRMRSVLNSAIQRNEERRIDNIAHLSSSDNLLNHVAKYNSTFTRNDLYRATKIIEDKEVRERLVESALSHKSIVQLYDETGKKLNLYTTKEVRNEEKKLIRMSSYVANIENNIHSKKISKTSVPESIKTHINHLRETNALSDEQCDALTHLIMDKSGLRIMRGRAGSGKSRVLGQLAEIYNANNVSIIGLAPTHKAREVFEGFGCKSVDTVKGMLFKLHNGRFDLPKNSVLVVDEAGMIGNDDYLELLRVAATRNCNVILAGDEKQISSVSRGGMFELFAQSYGSCSVLDIKRQQFEWGREVASLLSHGEVKQAVDILSKNGAIIRCQNATESMYQLLHDWYKDQHAIDDKLILAVKNSHVTALNHGARQHLRMRGLLGDEEINVDGKYYTRGDKIIIKKTDKNLDIKNGDIAKILKASEKEFVIELDNKEDKNNTRKISFNPSEYSNFTHGYATTIFGAQGVSSKSVYFFHNGFAGLRNSYVALSRMIENVKIYTNAQATYDNSLDGNYHLVKQLSLDTDKAVSLNYLTKSEYDDLNRDREFDKYGTLLGKILVGAIDYTREKLEQFTDKYIPKSEYYEYQEPKNKALNKADVSKVLDAVLEQNSNHQIEKKIVGGNELSYVTPNMIKNDLDSKQGVTPQMKQDIVENKFDSPPSYDKNTKSNLYQLKQTSKQRFYANIDREKHVKAREEAHQTLKEEYARDTDRMRCEAKFVAARIARDLLGSPNKRLSNNRELRFGESGKVVVTIAGNRAGIWYDFSECKGGDMFDLVNHVKGGDFKSSRDYIGSMVGINNNTLKLVKNDEIDGKYANYIKNKEEQLNQETKTQDKIDKLYDRSKDIGEQSVAYRYLSCVRNIDTASKILSTSSSDIKTAGIYVVEYQKYMPALIAFAKNSENKITGYQQIILDPKTNDKADIETPKRSIGKITGSFVDLGHCSNGSIAENIKDISKEVLQHKDRITIIAEGIETGLSIKQALHNDQVQDYSNCHVVCSLGVSNIKNYQPTKNEKIIIASDNDGIDSVTNKVISNAKAELESKGAFVAIVKPQEKGDFNDILKGRVTSGNTVPDKSINVTTPNGREKEISAILAPVIAVFSASKVDEFLRVQEQHMAIKYPFDNQDKEHLSKIRKYDISEREIVDEYRNNYKDGRIKLTETANSLDRAITYHKDNKQIFQEALKFGYDKSEQAIIKQTTFLSKEQIDGFYQKMELDNVYKNFEASDDKRYSASSYRDALKAMDGKIQYFATLEPKYENNRKEFAGRTKIAKNYKQDMLINKLDNVCSIAIASGIKSEKQLIKELGTSLHFKASYEKIDREIEVHNVKNNIDKFSMQKDKANTTEGLLNIFKEQQSYLLDISKTMKYPAAHSADTQKLINNAQKHENKDIVGELKHLTNFMENKKFTSDGSITEILKSITDPRKAYNSLLREYHNEYISVMHSGIKTIENGKTCSMNNKAFSCVVDFMDYIKKNHVHQYAPHKEIQKTYDRVIENQKQLEKNREIDLDMSL